MPAGSLKDGLVEILGVVQMVSSPGELISKYVKPALNMLWGVSSAGNLSGANATADGAATGVGGEGGGGGGGTALLWS